MLKLTAVLALFCLLGCSGIKAELVNPLPSPIIHQGTARPSVRVLIEADAQLPQKEQVKAVYAEALRERLSRWVEVLPAGEAPKSGSYTLEIVLAAGSQGAWLRLPPPGSSLVGTILGTDNVRRPITPEEKELGRLGYLPNNIEGRIRLMSGRGMLREGKFDRGTVMPFMEPLQGNGDYPPEDVQREGARGLGRYLVIWLRKSGLLQDPAAAK